MARTVSGRRLEEAGLVMLVMWMAGSFPRPAGSCSTDFGTGLPCLLPYSLGGETRFSCTTVGPAAEEGEGVVPRCPTRLLQGGEASGAAQDWGVCHTDCHLRRYHTNQELLAASSSLAAEFPSLASTYTIGQSVKGQPLQVLRVTSGADRERKLLKPRVRLSANMHGNEVTGREMLLQLARLLARGFGTDNRVTSLMSSMEVHLLPSLNPDGWLRATEGECGGQDHASGRLNEAGVDLNRDFPTSGEDLEDSQPETRAAASWITSGPWLIGANFHDGAVVVSYPWDHYIQADQKTGDHPTPDQEVFRALASSYAQSNPGMRNSSGCLKYHWLGPTTNGAAWYPKNGTLKDFAYREAASLDLVVELSCCKFPPAYFLPREWESNRESLLSLLEWAARAVRGLVLDLKGGVVEGALVSFTRDTGRAPRGKKEEARAGVSVTSTTRGEYWKVLLPGVYKVEASLGRCRAGSVRLEVGEGQARQADIVIRDKFNCREV